MTYARLSPALLALLSIPLSACFTPNDMPDASETDGTDGTESGDTSTTADTTASTTTSSSDTTASTTDDTADTTATTTGPEPYCGDGNVDDNEDCDDGEDNALDHTCLPDCTLNTCGDGNLSPEEACDDGNNNALEVGACAPDCSRVIEEKAISFTEALDDGDLGVNPVGLLDGLCPSGSKALFALPGVREASTTPYQADNLVDWPLQPYTAYTRADGTLLWITDDTPLLGVRNGASEPLLNVIYVACNGQICLYYDVITGLNADWTSSLSNTCNGWANGTDSSSVRFGNPSNPSQYLESTTAECGPWGLLHHAYCVEQ